MHKQIDLPMQVRSANFVPGTVNEEERTVEMVWSTGAPVRRTNWMTGKQYDESLSVDPAHVDLSRLNGGAPLLNSHDASSLDSILGVVEKAWIANGEGRAVVRFSSRDAVAPTFKDVQEGILRNVSVGYRVRKYEITEEAGKVPQWRAVDWLPMELSAVPIGADPGAGFRSTEPTKHTCQLIHTRGVDEMPEPVKTDVATEPVAEAASRAMPPTGAEVPSPQEGVTQPQGEIRSSRAPASTHNSFVDTEAMTRQAIIAERQRTAEIYGAQEKLKIDRSFADQLVNGGVSLDEARRSLIDEAAKRSSAGEVRNSHIVLAGQRDDRTTRREAVANALLHRFSPGAYPLSEQGREYRSMSLLELSKEFAGHDGRGVRGYTRDEVVTRSFHTESDFPNILANVANKTLRDAYQATQRTFLPFCRQVNATDFKLMTRVQLGEAPSLQKVGENGEYTRGTLGEGKESYRIETFGKIIAISRQVIINDDLNALTRIPQLFGVAAANLESDVVWGIINANPNMGDGIALFHASHKNMAATGAVISVASLGLGRKIMATQTGVDGKTVINVRPSFIIVPAALEVTAEQLLAVNMVPAKSTDVVPQSLRTLTVIAEPRLDAASDKAWYMSANPGQIDTVEYAYLEGQNGVYIENRTGFDVDGVEIKARLDFGAKAIDWRGLYKNPGA
ncbi:MAG: peptidase U37 [Magnetococcales bacterium]|nr:peptidase U37 [Magnetococcales bacterium]